MTAHIGRLHPQGIHSLRDHPRTGHARSRRLACLSQGRPWLIAALLLTVLTAFGGGNAWRGAGDSALAAASPQGAACPTAIELEVLRLLNQERQKAGISLLSIDIRLQQAARLHSQDMAVNNFFSHSGSDGSSLEVRLDRQGYPWLMAGENIAAGYSSAAGAVQGWMNSPGHRANILTGGYEHIGIGYAYSANSTYGSYWTTDFGAARDGGQPPPPNCGQVTPTSTPPATRTPTPSPTPAWVFADVPPSHWAHEAVERLYAGGYVAGCSAEPRLFCPEDTMTRAESAVLVVRGVHGAGFVPSTPSASVFADVPLSEWYAKWAEQLWRDRFTSGCNTAPLMFCPLRLHTRAEGAVFFERMLHGADFLPPTPSFSPYADVPLSEWYAKWVVAAYGDGLTSECEAPSDRGDPFYRPADGLSRAQAACMMAKAKGFP